MSRLSRRQFGAVALAAAVPRAMAASPLDDVLDQGIRARGIPCVAAMVASRDRILYRGAFGKRDGTTDTPVQIDSLFAIASMTKALTTVAALQLVDQGKVSLDAAVPQYLPELARLQILEGFDGDKPLLRPAQKQVTLRHLLTHTSGFSYGLFDAAMNRYNQVTVNNPPAGISPPVTPLMFEPGSRWQYGTGCDWAGRLVERSSKLSLEDYFQKNILQPLGMADTSYILPKAKLDRLASMFRHGSDGSWQEDPRTASTPREFNGGGGIFSTCADFTKFMQMILRRGARDGSSSRGQILSSRMVDLMSSNQIGPLQAGILKTTQPAISSDVDLFPGHRATFSLGFLRNEDPVEDGRSAGSLAWAGIGNTLFWIDPARGICAVLMMQFLPFADKGAASLLGDFERGVYRL